MKAGRAGRAEVADARRAIVARLKGRRRGRRVYLRQLVRIGSEAEQAAAGALLEAGERSRARREAAELGERARFAIEAGIRWGYDTASHVARAVGYARQAAHAARRARPDLKAEVEG